MTLLVILLATTALCIGFVVLTVYEAEHGMRFFGERRARFDKQIGRIAFIIEHVDFAAFLYDEVRHLAHSVAHSIAHLSLQSVRAIERLLTRLVRSFRAKEASLVPRESTREFVKTLSNFKEQLKATTPEVPEIQ